MKNEFDWHIQINKMQNLNDMIGKQLECVDAERLAHTRQKKIRSKKRKDTFVVAKRRHNLCASRGVGGKHTAEGFMKKGYGLTSFSRKSTTNTVFLYHADAVRFPSLKLSLTAM